MKTSRLASFLTLSTLLSIQSYAADITPVRILNASKKNIIATLYGVNQNLQGDALQTLLELKRSNPDYNFEETVPILIDLLESHRTPGIRVLAALNLAELRSETAKLAIRKAARQNSSKVVRNICTGLIQNF